MGGAGVRHRAVSPEAGSGGRLGRRCLMSILKKYYLPDILDIVQVHALWDLLRASGGGPVLVPRLPRAAPVDGAPEVFGITNANVPSSCRRRR